MPVERVVRNRLGFVKKTSIPEDGENLTITKAKGKDGSRLPYGSKRLAYDVRVLGTFVKLERDIELGHEEENYRRRETPHFVIRGRDFYDLSGRKGKVEGKDKSGAVIVYRFVSSRRNPLQEIARLLHR